MQKELPKRFDHKKLEPLIYKEWEKSGYFNPDKLPARHKEPFCILMPPPNANDPLHIGHALFVSLEDTMTRYARMRGKKALWLPGMDHAGFETQIVYEKKLQKQGRSRLEMSREEFYKEVWDYTQKNRDTVRNQLKKLGSSCDWSRETFTLDAKIIKTVYKTFKDMHGAGLIYRDERLINYCVKHQTAFSELEIKHKEQDDTLYFIKYGPVEVATVRPETIFGDTAVAVNPNDKRYKKYIGKEIEADLIIEKRKLRVVADKEVDPKFGTGALKITPAHDAADYEMWLRHKKDIGAPIQTIGKDGRLNEKTGKYKGMKILEAREAVAYDLQKRGLLKKTEAYKHAVSVCYKCENTIEPMLMKQWFVDIKPLTSPAVDAVKKGKIKIMPPSQRKVYLHWMLNIKDWNISRQNWWGIEIPAWKCVSCTSTNENEKWIITDGEKPEKCPECENTKLERDPDVFDTWFSSGQWPFATLDWPKGKDFKTFYPTDIMETGYDILFFWVARQIMLGLYKTGKVPFKTVYLHGLVRDKDRQKMSKSKGNVIDPLGTVEEYGADALRMALIVGNSIGKDPVISEEKIRGYRNFSTKLWNVTRFLLLNSKDNKLPLSPEYDATDKKILAEFDKTAKKVTDFIEKYEYWNAAETAYHYAWHTFADKVLENSKSVITGENEKNKITRLSMLIHVWGQTLKILHPFAPFVTEELYGHLPLKNKKLLLVEEWPSGNAKKNK
ncbi:MAG: valine--tRNA ligase [Candidatus Spechtbacterales bacterium]